MVQQAEETQKDANRQTALWLFTMGTLQRMGTPIVETLQTLALIPGFKDISDFICERVKERKTITVAIGEFLANNKSHQNLSLVLELIKAGEDCRSLETTCFNAALLMCEGDQQALHQDFFKMLGMDRDWLAYIYGLSLLQSTGVALLPSITLVNKLRPNGVDLEGVVKSFHSGLLLSESLTEGAKGTPLVAPLFMKFILDGERDHDVETYLAAFFPAHVVGQIISTQFSETARRLLRNIALHQKEGFPILKTLRILDEQEGGVFHEVICSFERGCLFSEALEENRAALSRSGLDHPVVAVLAEVGQEIGDLATPLYTLSGLRSWKN